MKSRSDIPAKSGDQHRALAVIRHSRRLTLALLLTQLTGRPVEDKTGLKGLFDFEIVIDLQTLMNLYAELGINVGPMPPLPEGPSLTTQLQEDLGLKLDSQRGPGEVLVVDSAERPSPD